ncbi:hypothetical protein PR048_028982 [Dryococelus australis]|uniref:Uncharacterized protein n=1 Tax=Dryococelus australis TaxID=614101 RepID=A0ABQ9GFR8_9NEOP|nr:hypothetical protein PR048_028982 [Dryococelus australis]
MIFVFGTTLNHVFMKKRHMHIGEVEGCHTLPQCDMRVASRPAEIRLKMVAERSGYLAGDLPPTSRGKFTKKSTHNNRVWRWPGSVTHSCTYCSSDPYMGCTDMHAWCTSRAAVGCLPSGTELRQIAAIYHASERDSSHQIFSCHLPVDGTTHPVFLAYLNGRDTSLGLVNLWFWGTPISQPIPMSNSTCEHPPTSTSEPGANLAASLSKQVQQLPHVKHHPGNYVRVRSHRRREVRKKVYKLGVMAALGTILPAMLEALPVSCQTRGPPPMVQLHHLTSPPRRALHQDIVI